MRAMLRPIASLSFATMMLLVLTFAITVGGADARPISQKSKSTVLDRANPEPGCPPGWVQAVPPLNPALGCLPNTITSGENVDRGFAGQFELDHVIAEC